MLRVGLQLGGLREPHRPREPRAPRTQRSPVEGRRARAPADRPGGSRRPVRRPRARTGAHARVKPPFDAIGEKLATAISDATEVLFEVTAVEPVSGGCIHNAL